MGIYDNWEEFEKLARESAGTAEGYLPPSPSKWTNFWIWVEAISLVTFWLMMVPVGFFLFYFLLDVINLVRRLL